MIYAGLIDEALDNVTARIVSAFHGAVDPWLGWLFDPLLPWYFWGSLAFAAALLVGWFFPFKWVRAGLGFVLIIVGAFIAGGKVMHDEMAEKYKAEQAKRRRK